MKAYKLYNLITNKVFFSRDVKFDEIKVCDQERKEKERIEVYLEEEKEQEVHVPENLQTPHASPH